MFCFDTDVVGAALQRDPPLHLVRRLARTPADEQCTTSITVAEILYGAARHDRAGLAARLRELIAAAQTVIPFDDVAADVYGPLRATLERSGTRLDEPTLRIASIALARDLTLVTGNARLYERVPGLRIENWLEPDGLEELEEPIEEVSAARTGEPTAPGDGTVRHPGVVPQLEERIKDAARRARAAEERASFGR